MEVTVNAALVVAGLVLLCFGGNWLVGGGEMIARRFRISSFVIGATVIAYGTSTPELAASIAAAAGGHGAIILGNVVGSNIANVGMVIGISAILLPLAVGRDVLRREVPIMIGASLLLVALSADGEISQYDGYALLAALGVIMYRTMRIVRRQRSAAGRSAPGPAVAAEAGTGAAEEGEGEGTASRPEPRPARAGAAQQPSARFYARNIGMIGAGIALLYAGAILTVDNAVMLAKAFGLSEKVIGLTVVAVGTSLPELITSVMAIRKGNGDIGIGNIIGSNIYNVLMIMGVGAALGSVAVQGDIYMDYGIMLGFSIALLIALKTRVIGRRVGICLAAGYVAYIGIALGG